MNSFAFSSLITAILALLLGFFVFFANKRKRLNQSWLIVSIFVILWIVGLLGSVISPLPNEALFWQRILYIGTAFIPSSFFQYIIILTNKQKKYKKIIIISYILSLFFSLCSFTSLMIDGINKRTYFDYWPVNTGKIYPFFLIFFVSTVFVSIRLLIIEYKKTKSKQLLYMLVASLIGFIGGSTNFVLDFGLNIYPVGNFFVSFYVFVMAYAIVKHKLLDIRLVILRTLSYSLIVIFASVFIVGVGVLLPQLVTNINTQIIIGMSVSIVVVLTLDPIKKYIANTTDKLFFKAKINYQNLLHELSVIINKEINLNNLTQEIETYLTKNLKIQSVRILFPEQGDSVFVDEDPDGKKVIILSYNSYLSKYINVKKHIVILEDLERKIEDTTDEKQRVSLEKSKEELDKLNASVLFPVLTEDRIVAILVLGGKLSGDPFSNEDLNLLQLLGPQLASALEKAQLYEEIRLFNVKLEKDIALATEKLKQKNLQLEDHNRFLAALQKVTNLITQTLEFKKVTQSIVDVIYTELGFVGGTLLFLGESRRKIFLEAITKTKLTEKVLNLLPKPFNEYWGDYTTDKTLSIEAMKARQVRVGPNLADFFSPPVPKEACEAMQKMAGIKSVVSVPIVTEKEVVGVIDFLLAKPKSEISRNDHNMMQAITDQTGVVYQNIELVRRLEETNQQLGVANEHLKELDQAKSEFVSIASHQLRTPMTGIMGYLSMLMEGDYGKLTLDIKKIIESLLDASQRMIRLINLFLDVSKIESGKLILDKRPMRLEDMIDKELQVLAKIAKDKKLKLEYKRPKTALPLLTIDDKITDVILNLVDNAIKYTEKGSIILTSEREGEWVHVKVKDTGRGLDPKEAKGLFTKFVRGFGIAQVNPDGSGLGLYVARRIVEVHGGKIWVESDGPGKGSTFQFTLQIKPVDVKLEAGG